MGKTKLEQKEGTYNEEALRILNSGASEALAEISLVIPALHLIQDYFNLDTTQLTDEDILRFSVEYEKMNSVLTMSVHQLQDAKRHLENI